jgi:hypothetical protein
LIDDNLAVVQSLATGDGGSGGGVAVVGASAVTIQQSTIARNHALEGGGVSTDSGSQVALEHSTITDNEAAQVHAHSAFVGGVGGGVSANAQISISDSIIANNVATGPESPRGGGLFVVANGTQSITNTVVTHNTADGGSGSGGDGGGVLSAAATRAATLVLDHAYVIENLASQGGAGGISNEGTLVLTHTTIKDNSGQNCSGGTGCPP